MEVLRKLEAESENVHERNNVGKCLLYNFCVGRFGCIHSESGGNQG
jgi:hypothetical protein